MQDRRLMFALLAGLFVAGAARSVLAQNETKAQPSKEAQPTKEPAKEAAAQKPKEKTYLFEMRNKPWAGVIEWVCDNTGLPYIGENQPPQGTFTYIAPRVAPLTPKEFTMPQIIDIINEALIPKKFVLIRRASAVTLVDASQQIPPEIVPRISLDQLPKYGNSEIVQVVYPLKSLIAEDIAPEAKKMLGNFSEVIVLSKANKLMLQDQVGVLRRLIKELDDIEKSEEAPEAFSHKCVYIRARDAEVTLRNLLGNPNETVQVEVRPGSSGQPMGGSSGERRDREGFGRPPGEFGSGFGSGFGQFGSFGRPQSTIKERSRKYTIATDDRTNTLYLSGPSDKIALAKNVLAKLDVGKTAITIGEPFLHIYHITTGNAAEWAKTLLEINKGTASSMRIQPQGNTSLFIVATPEDHMTIAKQLQAGRPAPRPTEKIAITSIDAEKAAKFLIAMFGDPKTGAPFIDFDPGSNSVIVQGTSDQVADVKVAIKAITSDAAGSGTMRIITIDKGSALTVAEEIERMFKKMRPGTDVKILVPGSAPEAPPPERKKILQDPKEQPISYQDTPLPQLKKEEKKQSVKGGITITAFGNKLIVTGDDPDALALVQELVRLMTATNSFEGDFEYIRLKNANATEAARILDEAFNGPKQGGGGRGPGGGNPLSMLQGGPAALIGGMLGMGGGGAREERVRVVADTSTNALLVKAKPIDMLTIRRLLGTAIDSGETDSNAVIKTFIVRPGLYGREKDGNIKYLAEATMMEVKADGTILKKDETGKMAVMTNDKDEPIKADGRNYYNLLVYANAVDVAGIIREVYRESMNNNTRIGGNLGGGFGGGFNPFGGGGGGTNQRMNMDANGNPRGVSLSVGIDDKTNSLVLACPKSMYEDIINLVWQLDTASMDSKQIVKVVPVSGIDPLLVQEALDAIQGRSPARPSGLTGFGGGGTGGNFGGGFGGGNFGGGTNFGGRGFSGFGGGANVMPLGGGGFPQFGGGGGRGMGGGGKGGGGRKGGGGGREQSRGPDFFAPSVKDDRQATVLFDPAEESDSGTDDGPGTVPSGFRVPRVLPSQFIAYQEKPLPPIGGKPGPAPGPKDMQPKDDSIVGPRLNVVVEPLEQLGVIVLRSSSQADMDAALRILKLIQDYGAAADIEFLTVPLKHADATSVINTLNQLFGRIQLGANNTQQIVTPRTGQQQQPFGQQQFGQFQQQQQQPAATATQAAPAGSVVMIALPRINSILLASTRARTKDILREIERLDVPPSAAGKAVAFPLTRAAAWRVASQIQTFYNDRYNEAHAANQIRVTYDDYANTVFVQAAPGDLAEIRSLIDLIDNTMAKSTNDLRVIPLRNAVADELANTITRAISDGFVPTTGGQAGQQPGGQFPGGQIPGQQQPFGQQQFGQQGQLGQIRQTKVSSLSFVSPLMKDGKPIETGILEDIRITSDPRTNTLIVAAPDKTMQLIYALVKELDIAPVAQSRITIFTLKKADAAQLANSLQSLFLGAAGQLGQRTQQPGQQQPFGQQLGQAGTQQTRPLLIQGATTPDGAPIIDLRITIDDRTNSLIVAGSQNDVDIIEGIIRRLDDAKVPERRQETYRLRNATATDIATSLTDYFTKIYTIGTNSNQLTPYQTMQQEVVITAEPVSNSLLISATPKYFDEVMKLVAQLDAPLPQVVVQVLIAEVDLGDSNEFGVEIGLQSPVLFRRAFNTGGSSFIPTGVTTSSTFNPGAFPGQNPATNTGTNIIDQGIVGYQGLGSLGVGRISSTNNIGGFVFSAASESFNLLIRALKVQKRLDVLSRPQLMTLDGQTSRVNFGQQYPIVTNVVVSPTAGTTTQNIDRPVIGVKLEVTPKIMPDGRVVMRIIPEVSSVVSPPINLGNGQISTAVNIQQIETTVTAYDGETIALGGLITHKDAKVENKIPWLGDIPYLGAAFRYRTHDKIKTELLIIMTPHVVYGKAEADRILAEEARRMDWVLGDVLKLHGHGFLDAAAGCLPVSTIIDSKSPILEQAPAPKAVMPPAGMKTPSTLPPAVSLAPSILPKTVSQGLAPLPPVTNTLEKSVIAPTAAPDAGAPRIQVRNANDVVPPLPSELSRQTQPERSPPVFLPTYPNPQPVTPMPTREVQR